MQSAFKFSLFAHPCPFFCYSIRLVRAENAENSVTKYTCVIHDHDCHSTVIEKVNLHDIITVQGFGVGGGRGQPMKDGIFVFRAKPMNMVKSSSLLTD